MTLTLDLESDVDAQVVAKFTAFLEERGFIVIPEDKAKWEGPGKLAERLRVHPETIARALRNRNCPRVALDRGPNGRLIEICSNPGFDAFVRRNCATRTTTTNGA